LFAATFGLMSGPASISAFLSSDKRWQWNAGVPLRKRESREEEDTRSRVWGVDSDERAGLKEATSADLVKESNVSQGDLG
jgi:hypothetical protein